MSRGEDRVVALWNGIPSTLVHTRDGENSVYEFRSDRSRYFLRLTEESHRTRSQLEAELDFVMFASSRGIAVACPIASNAGSYVEGVTLDREGSWHAVVFAAAEGDHFQYFSRDVDRPLFRAWGSAMAALHEASRDFEPHPSRRRPSWTDQDTTVCDVTSLPVTEAEARREYARVADWLRSLNVTAENWGLIHGDFERTNFVLRNGTLQVYDFDDACYHWYVADIAHALWAFRRAPPGDRGRFLEWFLEGYGERRSVGAEAREQLSWFVRLRSVSLFINRLYRNRTFERVDATGEWAGRLRAEFENPFSW